MLCVSVIVPVYKVESYLHRCVDSILNQTFTDFELILVDDGSPDGCPAICDEYSAQDSRVKVVHKTNGGLSSARNAGLDVATGKYVLFVDSDDYVAPNLLETVIRLFDNSVDRVTYNMAFVDSHTGIMQDALPRGKNTYDICTDAAKQEFFTKEFVAYQVSWSACASAFLRSIIEENHIRFVDTKKVFAEDLLFSLCYTAFCTKIAYVGEPLYFYVTNQNDSIMSKANQKINADRMNELCKCFVDFIKASHTADCLNSVAPIICFELMNRNLIGCSYRMGLSKKEIRTMVLEEVHDFSFFKNVMNEFTRQAHSIKWKKWYWRWYESLLARYWCKGRWLDWLIIRFINAITTLKKHG